MVWGHFHRQERQVLTRLRRALKSVKGDLRLPFGLFDVDEEAEKWAADYEPFLINLLKQEYRRVNGRTFNPSHPAAVRAIGERVLQFSRLPNRTTGLKIKRALEVGFQNGEDVEQIASRIQQVFRQAKRSRTRLIARTEVFGASNFATYLGAVDGGMGWKMWITSRDERVRFSHRIDGQVKKIDEYFELADGRKMPYPQDFNERCIMVPLHENPYAATTPVQPQPEPPAPETYQEDPFPDIPFGTQPPERWGNDFSGIPDVHDKFIELFGDDIKQIHAAEKAILDKVSTGRLTDNELEQYFYEAMERGVKFFRKLADTIKPANLPHGKIKYKFKKGLAYDPENEMFAPYSEDVARRWGDKLFNARAFDDFLDEVIKIFERFVPEGKTMELKIFNVQASSGTYFYPRKGKEAIVIEGRTNPISAILHEMQHALEYYFDKNEVMRKYFELRTAADPPGAPTKYDEFVYDYMGTDYLVRTQGVVNLTEILPSLWSSLFRGMSPQEARAVFEEAQIVSLFVAFLRGWFY